MKRRIIFLITAICLLALLTACGLRPGKPDGPEPQTTTGGGNGGSEETMDFQSIKISESGMMAFSTVYLAEKTDDGVHLEYYLGRYGSGDEEEKTMIRQIDGNQELYQTVAQLAGQYGLRKWDGFSGSDPNVLDGYGFYMEAVLEDGTVISAHGSNKFPDGYHGYLGAIDAICSRGEVTEQKFVMEDYELTLPESWIGTVLTVYREGYVGFEVQTDVQNRTLMCIYNEPYEYGAGTDYCKTITSYEKDGQTWYIVFGRMPDSYSAYDEMNDAQKAICDNLDADMEKIAESLTLR